MIETKVFCDKCKKEIKCIPPGPDSSVIKLEGEKRIQIVKGPLGTSFPRDYTIFDDSPYPTEIMLCHDCGLLFKKYMDAFWKK